MSNRSGGSSSGSGSGGGGGCGGGVVSGGHSCTDETGNVVLGVRHKREEAGAVALNRIAQSHAVDSRCN